ncbi:AGL115Wp [Eremothecium gossypii ATCC 10895]|uniref:Protein ARV1 n=1 Tax=Eremothecium gossypii (strain ATCC 10895 / CBS 109.51 / FGSC 9923 / NRRL Y-1056) TaxID=284811 RepID=ARV1_EREGS|nr:AGL115Wp [Eremothecium gossypii ATCC 10895]Q750Q7.1 RecName: Full=Protein ARV1 [Eremothecium gossypii ATCC 10895]AAS54376.1 AGL115Wp [Eremothecium gossypii ATCC 10895]AEY98703.1 FAGL115Wp [Eremothecium gossypii FDAG1]
MICINCCCHVESLYVAYPGDHIRLTDCWQCGEVVDRYVEFDNVLLFIDLLLLKPGAYRHLVYNSLEVDMRRYPEHGTRESGFRGYVQDWLLWFRKYDRLNRIWLLLITFEVYLMWMTEEKKYNNYYREPATQYGWHLLTGDVLSLQNPLLQYLFFAVYVIGDLALLHKLTRESLLNWSQWGQDLRYAKDIVSYTILLSYGAKIFPILMLIWPYDSLVSTSIIKWIANFYIVESLRIVTSKSYSYIILLFAGIFIVRSVVLKPVLALIVSRGNMLQAQRYLWGEYELFKFRFLTKRDIFL